MGAGQIDADEEIDVQVQQAYTNNALQEKPSIEDEEETEKNQTTVQLGVKNQA